MAADPGKFIDAKKHLRTSITGANNWHEANGEIFQGRAESPGLAKPVENDTAMG